MNCRWAEEAQTYLACRNEVDAEAADMAAALKASMEQAEAAEAAENANKQPMEDWDGEQLCRHFGASQFLSQV